jgi:type I restriction enzyme S subunit
MTSKTKTTDMKEDGRPALVPKLRFPEFLGAVTWHEGRIADIAVSESSSRALNKLSLKSEGYPVYGADSCVGFIDSFDQTDDYIAIVKDGSGVGRLALKRGKSSVLGTLAYIKCKPGSETKLTWLYYCLNSLDLRQFIKGSGIPHIYFSDYATHEVLIPALPEQQKIAECLSSVDELIAAQARKVDALKTHKKGLMQQLFPRDGETQPRLRFPEFQNAEEWDRQPLKEVFSIFQGFAFSSNDSVEQGSRWLKIADVGIQLMNHDAPSFLPADYRERFAKFSVRKGDYVIALTRPILSGQLKIAQVDNIFDGALLNQRVGKLITSQHPAFVFFLLQSWKLIGDIEKSISGNDPPNLSAQQIEGIKTYIPRIPEQQRIADCLTSLDNLIAAQTQKHEALKTHKKGLMQQLFPSPEEV